MTDNPGVLILDEPTRSLSTDLAQHVVNVLQQLNEGGVTIICASHDPVLVASASTPPAR
jgi:ABC-type ATPase involved in cell division